MVVVVFPVVTQGQPSQVWELRHPPVNLHPYEVLNRDAYLVLGILLLRP